MSFLNSKMQIFVTGTDTGIGKTVVSLLLMHNFFSKGYRPFYLKPFQTGCKTPYETGSDTLFIYRHIEQLKDLDPAGSVIYCFSQPKAPWFAARNESKRIDITRVEKIITQKKAIYGPLIIEGAGGLHVPITENLLMIDLIEKLPAAMILVARAGLGTINHTLLSIESLIRRGITPVAIIFVDSDSPNTPPDMIRENMEAVEKFSGISVLGTIGKIEDFSNPPSEYVELFKFIRSPSQA